MSWWKHDDRTITKVYIENLESRIHQCEARVLATNGDLSKLNGQLDILRDRFESFQGRMYQRIGAKVNPGEEELIKRDQQRFL